MAAARPIGARGLFRIARRGRALGVARSAAAGSRLVGGGLGSSRPLAGRPRGGLLRPGRNRRWRCFTHAGSRGCRCRGRGHGRQRHLRPLRRIVRGATSRRQHQARNSRREQDCVAPPPASSCRMKSQPDRADMPEGRPFWAAPRRNRLLRISPASRSPAGGTNPHQSRPRYRACAR